MGVLDDAIREHLDLKRRRGADPAEIERAEQEALGPVRRDASARAAVTEAEPPRSAAPPIAGDRADEFAFEIAADDLADERLAASGPDLSEETGPAPGGIAAPDYDHPDLDAFGVSDAPDTGEFDLPASGSRPKRRGLFGRRSHEADTSFGERTPLPAELPQDDPFAEEPEVSPPPTAGEAVGQSPAAGPQPTPPPRPARPQPPALRITPDAELGHTVEYDVEKAFAEESAAAAEEDILEETPDFLADAPDHDRLWFEQKPPPDFDFDN